MNATKKHLALSSRILYVLREKPSLVLMLTLLVFSFFSSLAAQAADCIQVNNEGVLQLVVEDTCTQFVLMSQVELDDIRRGSFAQMQETLHLLFAFDVEIFAVVELGLILAFLSSHFAGRIVRWLGK